MNWLVSAMAAGSLTGLLASPAAFAQGATDTGKGLSERYCAACHVVTPTGKAGWTDAPSFQAIADRPGVTAAWVTDYTEKQHMEMMHDMRPHDQAAAIAGYLMSLRAKQ
jgi:mono/diheme cytochrome c family protein